MTDVVPFLFEDMLKSNSGVYKRGDDWVSFVLLDRKLVTGQNPASLADAARELLSLLN